MSNEQSLDFLLQELKELKAKHFDSTIEWYQSHAKRPRLFFHLAGYAIIILSISIPFLTVYKFTGSELLLSVIALIVAALTGISSFAQWDSRWRSYKQAQFALESLDYSWNLRIIEIKRMNDPAEAQRAAIDATRKLFDNAKSVITSETEKYFESVRMPNPAKK